MSLNFTFHVPGYFLNYNQVSTSTNVETDYLQIFVYPVFYKQMVIEWSIPTSWGNCKFDVFRAEQEFGPWVKLTPAPVSGNFFKDATTLDFSKFQNGYYLVECELPSGKRVKSSSETWQVRRSTWVELRAAEIRRREALLLEKFVGVDSLIFRRKNFGQRCHNCWNPDTEQVTKDHCPVCLGTSFEGGYFPGFKTLFQYDPTPNDATLGYQGRVENNQITAWTISYPQINVFDLVLRTGDWKLYRVDHIQDTELQAVQVRQIVVLTELAKESIEFKLAQQALPEGYSS